MLFAKRVPIKDRIYFQSFEGHTQDALILLKYYFNKKGKTLEAFCNKWGLDTAVFKKNLFLSIALHDIGKLTKEFQKNIQEGKTSRNYPHPFFALPVLDKISFDNILDIPIPKLAILAHHSQLHNQIYSGFHIKDAHYLEKEIMDFCNKKIESFYKELKFNGDFKLQEINVQNLKNERTIDILGRYINPIKDDLLTDYFDNSPCYDKVKSVYTYFFSLLQLCDDYSSANFSGYLEENNPCNTNYSSVLKNPEKYIYQLEFSANKFKTMLFGKNTPYAFQEDLAKKQKQNNFLFAPCGRGKTEGSLWWAYNLSDNLNTDRIIFALPTQVTCNSMYKRFLDKEKGFGLDEKLVGLFHGKSSLALSYLEKQKKDIINNEEGTEEKSIKKIRHIQFMGNVFFKPITITTIDHLAYSFVHGFSQADFASGNLQNSIIIFDEVHYYETYTLGVLLSLFEKLRLQKIPHLLMTGTAPQFITDALNRIKTNYEITTDYEGLEYKPFIIKKEAEDDAILENRQVFENIKNEYQNNKNVFVILNRVNWAQDFYTSLKEYLTEEGLSNTNMILYHSRFIYKHRMAKEKEIEKYKDSKENVIIVATQVIEISLDISSDIMYSQIAPVDSINS